MTFKDVADCAVENGIYAIEVRLHDGNRLVDLACMVNAKGIRVFLGRFKNRFSEEKEMDYEGIVKSLKEISRYASDKDVEIWIETHNDFSIGRVLRNVLDDVACDNIKIIWDIIHSIEFGESPRETLDFLGNGIVHVHIKDGTKPAEEDVIDYTNCKLGEGILPIREIVNMLEDFGYEGYYSLECEKAWRPEIKGIFEGLSEVLAHFNLYMATITEVSKSIICRILRFL